MNVDEIREKYQGDDAFSKGANAAYHKAAKYKGKLDSNTRPVLNRITGLEVANAYANANKFKNASVGFGNSGWYVSARLSGNLSPVEAQAYAQDLLKAVAAIKKAPAIKK